MKCELWERLFDQHVEHLKERFTEEELEGANVGWGSSETSVETKIYSAKGGCKILVTYSNGGGYEAEVYDYS